MDIPAIISERISLSKSHVAAVCRLLFEESATIPFVSRYRKEATGGMDEVQIGLVAEMYCLLSELEKRKQTVVAAIETSGSMTDELRDKIEACTDAKELEDIYLPYKPKRRTKAQIARQKGLEPLADALLDNPRNIDSLARKAASECSVTVEEALQGASDIIAERVSEDAAVRKRLRRLFWQKGLVSVRSVTDKESEGAKYSDYFDFSEPVRRIPSHRMLAVMRGTAEGFLRSEIKVDDEEAVETAAYTFLPRRVASSSFLREAVADGYKRLLRPSLENETFARAKERADEEAIKIFCSNLRQLLLSPPLGACRVLAVDPGFRTGCKVVCLDSDGNLVHNETIYPHEPRKERAAAINKLSNLIESYKIEAVAIGDGTAGRQTEELFKSMRLPEGLRLFMVSEDGASVYSASAVAREEFPDYDVTVRGAVSIGRRLVDPLSELVKIEPESIGVGQYQHDVERSRLKESLDTVVESCVNSVGVDLNTASAHLLRYVSGIGPSLARSIVVYRNENGPFTERGELLRVPRLGAKAFEQCAGFMRIREGVNPLDNSAVHPESYGVVEKMARDLGVDTKSLIADKELQKRIVPERYVTDKTGMPTITDIISELAKPGRDPRAKIEEFEFSEHHSIDDLEEGMELPGIVTNITAFGAFVDVGVKQDGLVHISQLADRYVSDPSEVVRLHEHVRVRVLSVDRKRNRIELKKI